MWGLTHRPHKVKERLLNAPCATCAGYWAFGWSVAPFLVSSFTFPTGLIAAVYVLAIIQIVGCYQIYARPTFGAPNFVITLSGPCTYILQHLDSHEGGRQPCVLLRCSVETHIRFIFSRVTSQHVTFSLKASITGPSAISKLICSTDCIQVCCTGGLLQM